MSIFPGSAGWDRAHAAYLSLPEYDLCPECEAVLYPEEDGVLCPDCDWCAYRPDPCDDWD